MGLENGVIVRIKNIGYTKIPNEILRSAECGYTDKDHDTNQPYIVFEMIYWRKWEGARDAVIRKLHSKYDIHIDMYSYALDSEDVQMIIDTLEYYDDPNNWQKDGSPVWDYENDYIHDQITVDIAVLKDIVKFMRSSTYFDMVRDNKIEVSFYDSY